MLMKKNYEAELFIPTLSKWKACKIHACSYLSGHMQNLDYSYLYFESSQHQMKMHVYMEINKGIITREKC